MDWREMKRTPRATLDYLPLVRSVLHDRAIAQRRAAQREVTK